MNRFGGWGLAAAVAAGGGSALAAGPPGPVERPTLVNPRFGPQAPPKPSGPTVGDPAAVSATLPPAAVAESLRNEQEACLRRVAVCARLRELAAEKGDEALARQADELESQAKALYNARVAGLGVLKGKVPLAPPAETAAAQAGRLTAPPAPTPNDTASARPVREEPK